MENKEKNKTVERIVLIDFRQMLFELMGSMIITYISCHTYMQELITGEKKVKGVANMAFATALA